MQCSKAVQQGDVDAQYLLGMMLLEDLEGVPRDLAESGRLLGLAAQQGSAQALAALAEQAGVKAVAAACCAGCGKSEGAKICSKCAVARFCCKECLAHMWPTHKPFCREWQAEAAEGQPQDE